MSITVGMTAKIMASLENSGEPVEGIIAMTELTGCGTLEWSTRETGELAITGEEVEAINDIPGQSQCVISSKPISVEGVWKKGSNGLATGSNLAGTVYGNTIDLTEYVATSTPLLINYTKGGCVQNIFKATKVGTSRILTSVNNVSSEKGLSETVEVEVTSVYVPPIDPPDPPDPPIIPPSVPATTYDYEVEGPGSIDWNGYAIYDPVRRVVFGSSAGISYYPGCVLVQPVELWQYQVFCNCITYDEGSIAYRNPPTNPKAEVVRECCIIQRKGLSAPGLTVWYAGTVYIAKMSGTITISIDYYRMKMIGGSLQHTNEMATITKAVQVS